MKSDLIRQLKRNWRKLKKRVTQKTDGENSGELFLTKKKGHPFFLTVMFTSLKLILAAFIIVCFAGLGLVVGIGKAYIETAPEIDVAQLTISDRTSFLYDKNGNLITSIADVEYRDWVDIEYIPDMLQNAFIAVEDVRFYKHSGVDFKRLFSAALEILGNSNSSGGSTITQQLIKNKVLGSQRNYKRKIQEAYLALKLEKMVSKELILEAYLNDIFLGQSNYGVKTAAKDYFGKELSELSIRECAMLAGLPQSPYTYDPRRNTYVRAKMDITNERTDLVLARMYQAGYITSEQYNTALHDTVYILPVSEQKQMYTMPYFVEYTIYDVTTRLLSYRGLEDTTDNRNMVENELRTGGYHIYTTVDPAIQNCVQQTLAGWDHYPSLADSSKSVSTEVKDDGTVLETIQPQASAVVMDFKTGEIRAIVGGRSEPTLRKSLNRAYQSYNEVGSSIKPLSVYGPALDMGLSTGTIVPNMDGKIEGWNTPKGYPGGGLKSRYGPVTMRRGVISSLNVVAARVLMQYVTPEIGASYLAKLGANMNKINVDGAGLALGTSGLTPIQMTAAYSAIANEGVYLEPLSFTRVTDEDGNLVIDATMIRRQERVYQPSTAYMLVDMLTDAVKSGTGKKAKIENMTVAGKTGTNSDYASVYFCGITPYYCASVFIGHDFPVNKLKSGAEGGDYAAPLWQAFMSQIHEGLSDKTIIDSDPASLGLVQKKICTVSGKLATDACKLDSDHKPSTEWFLASNVPSDYCDMHVMVSLCKDSGGIANNYCPNESVQDDFVVLIPKDNELYWFEDKYLFKAIPNAIRTQLDPDAYLDSLEQCDVHSRHTVNDDTNIDEAKNLAKKVKRFIKNNKLSDEDVYTLQTDIEALESAIGDFEYARIDSLYSRLKADYDYVKNGEGYPDD